MAPVAASDVANFLACRRLTQLDLARARGELRPPREFDIGFRDLVRRGEVHERAVLERFRADGLDVADVSGAEDAAGATAEAIRGGAGVVYQGTLTGAAGGVTLFRADGNMRPLEDIEADVIRLAIGHYRGRMTEVARRLGIGRSTLYRKLGELGIDSAAA